MQLPEIGIDIRNQYPLVFGGGDLSDWTPAELGTELLCWLRPDELNPPNRLINTHLLNTWARSALNVPVLKGSETDPLGGSGAVFEISSNVTNTAAQVNQDAPGWSGGSEEMVVSVYYKAPPGRAASHEMRLEMGDGTTSWSIQVTPTSSWQRLDRAVTTSSGTTKNSIRIYPDRTSGVEPLWVWGPQMESGPDLTEYSANASNASGSILNWPDQSTHNNDGQQGVASRSPSVVPNILDGYSGAVFDGIDDYLFISDSHAASNYSFYWVMSLSPEIPGYFADSNNPRLAFNSHIAIEPPAFGWYAGAWTGYGTYIDNAMRLHAITLNGSGGSNLRNNGVLVTPTSGDELYTQSAIGNNTWTLGSRYSRASNWGNATIVEYIAVDQAIDPTLVEGYIQAKYPSLGVVWSA